MGVEIAIVYEGQLRSRAIHGPSGSELTTDAPLDNCGRAEHFSPTDLVAAALGSCILTLMGIRAAGRGLAIEGARVHVVKDMAANPRRVGALTVVVTMPARAGLTPDDRQALEQAALQCPVRQSLHPDVTVSMRFEYPE